MHSNYLAPMGNKYNHRQINKLLKLTESNANILDVLSTRVQRMEAELQKFRQNQDEEAERFSCSQHHRRGYHQKPPPHYHIQPQLDLDHLNEWSDSEFEVMAEPPSQHYKQQPPQLDQLTDAGETSSNEECEWGFCLVTRQNQHLSEADLLIPLFKKNPNYDEFSEWVWDVERF